MTPEEAQSLKEQQSEFVAAGLGLMATICLLFAVLYALHWWVKDTPADPQEIARMFIWNYWHFKSEPLERLRYLSALILSPLFLWMFFAIFRRFLRKPLEISFVRHSIYGALLVLLLIAASWFLYFVLKTVPYYINDSLPWLHPFYSLLFFLGVIQLILISRNRSANRIAGWLVWLAYVYLLVIIIKTCVFNEYYIFVGTGAFGAHFNPVFHSVVQVCLGKAVLVNLPSQYGLYPHFLEPLFRIIGLSVYSFTVTMGLLLALSFLCVLLVLRDNIRNKSLELIAFVAFIYIGFFLARIRFLAPESYFQVFPIRFLFPMAMTWLAWMWIKTRSRRYYALGFAASALAPYWNLDTGLIVSVAWLLLLLYHEILTPRPQWFRSCLRHLAVWIGAHLCALIALHLYFLVRYGAAPDLKAFASYQMIFYRSGFYMLPMPLVHPWMIVALIYLLGLLFAAVRLVQRIPSPSAELVFFISILGAGVFSYYQGRSHENLLACSWYPAPLLVILFADRLLRYWQARWIAPHIAVLSLVFLYLLSSAASTLAFNSARVNAILQSRRQALSKKPPTSVTRDMEFVRKHAIPGEEALVLSKMSSVYHLAGRMASPVKIPSVSELILKKDFETLMQFLHENHKYRVFLDKTSLIEAPQYSQQIYRTLAEKYDTIEKSSDGDLFILQPRDAASTRSAPATPLIPPKTASVFAHFLVSNGFAICDLNGAFINLLPDTMRPVLPGPALTVEVVVRPAARQPPYSHIIGTHISSRCEGFAIQQDGASTNSYVLFYGDGTTRWLRPLAFKLAAKEWNYLAVVMDGATAKAYINGALVQSGAMPTRIAPSSTPLFIGEWQGGGRVFMGDIAEARVMTSALSDTQIAATWNQMRGRLRP
ncbi:MAG: LamG domain-containing protein [Candidatus Sumerlaeota bacterium]|nr:LamG domain-containing protein [Candidatus Sumerlaeota bacterium]